MNLNVPGKELKIEGVSLNWADVVKVFRKLKKLVEDDGLLEVSKLTKPKEMPKAQWLARQEEIKQSAFRVTVTIQGANGNRVHGDSEDVFSDSRCPESPTTVYMTNQTAFRWWTKQDPARSFELFLDFNKPKLLDSENFVSSPTPNGSNLRVQADNEGWVASITEAVFGILNERRNRYAVIHRAFVYDFGLLIFGFPAVLYLCWKFSETINSSLAGTNNIVIAGGYVYLSLLALFVYRVLFGYTKWAFPSVELVSIPSSSAMHRRFWAAIVLGLLVNFIWELVK